MNTRKVALVAILTALSVGTNYAMVSIPNVKFMDFIVFAGGFCFGSLLGGLIGVLSWVVYGVLNPLGFSLGVWLATMFSEAIYGVAGGFIRKMFSKPMLESSRSSRINLGIFFGVVAVFLTLAYDIITTIVFWYAVPITARSQTTLLAVIIFGVPFTIAHSLSNAVFFSIGSVPVINVISKVVRGGEKPGNVEK